MMKLKNLEELKKIFPDAEIKEFKGEVGMSFEPRTQTDYELTQDGKIIGTYQHISVYQKDGKTLVCEFGEFAEN